MSGSSSSYLTSGRGRSDRCFWLELSSPALTWFVPDKLPANMLAQTEFLCHSITLPTDSRSPCRSTALRKAARQAIRSNRQAKPAAASSVPWYLRDDRQIQRFDLAAIA